MSLLGAMPIDAVRPVTSFIVLFIFFAISSGSPNMAVRPVASTKNSSMEKISMSGLKLSRIFRMFLQAAVYFLWSAFTRMMFGQTLFAWGTFMPVFTPYLRAS